MTIKINDKDLAAAAGEGMDQFLGTIIHAFKQQVGEEELNVQAMQQLSADQIDTCCFKSQCHSTTARKQRNSLYRIAFLWYHCIFI